MISSNSFLTKGNKDNEGFPIPVTAFVAFCKSSTLTENHQRAAFGLRCFPKTIEIPSGLQDHPVEACQTSRRLAGVLRNSGVRVLGDLHGRKVGDFAWERNCAFKTLHELDLLAHRAEFAQKSPSSGNGTTAAGFAIPESVCQLQFDELPVTKRLANVARAIGLGTLGDLKGRSALELLQCKACDWRTLAEIQQLIERAISGEFNEAQIEESAAVVELLTLLEQGMEKLSPRYRQFLLARIDGLTFAEIGRRHALTRARAHEIVRKALATLRKTAGPRIPRLLEMLKQRCLSERAAAGLTPTLLEQWIGDSSSDGGLETAAPWRLSREAQVRLIAALDKNIPCRLESSPKAFGLDGLDLDLPSLARALRLAVAPEIPRNSSAFLF